MFVAIAVIIGLSVLILGHEAGHFFAARIFKMKVDEFGFGFPPRIFAKKKGEVEYSLNWLPFGGFVKIAGEEDHLTKEDTSSTVPIPTEEQKRLFSFQPAWRRAIVMLAGVGMNFILGWLLVSLVLMIGTPSAIVITSVLAGSPADVVGLKSGDVVRGYGTADAFIAAIEANRGKEMTLHVFRGGKEVVFTAVPRVDHPANEGPLGIGLTEAGTPRQPFFRAVWIALKNSAQIFWATIVGIVGLLKSLVFHGKLMEDVVGPVGIFSVAQRTSEIGFAYLLQLIALISINLSVVNLLPFPALDGGRFLMICIEKIKGSPISQKTERAINAVGFAFLILLMIAVTVRDIINL